MLYNDPTDFSVKKQYTLSLFSENHIGLLNRITVIFTRRKINIESICASESEVEGVYRYTIVVNVTKPEAEKLVKQIEKLVEVLKAFMHEESEIVSQELALYKLHINLLNQNESIEKIVREHHARILAVEKDFMVIEKTGNKSETQELFKSLEKFGVLEYASSGRVAITKPMKELTTYLQEMEDKYAATKF
jgi:acetolactate synthase-1/3 small subunit